jgi:hypothetical protein
MLLPPIVYLGPSLSPEEALALLPGARIQPPIHRGELYRDRMLRYSVFVILDGAFFQNEAVSPREVVDVLGDGALVVGASSMGALRAAECWPAGMRGVGAIYRLFRAGRLRSDDEVAVSVDPDSRHRALSVPLINVRHALRKAVRARLLSLDQAQAAVEAAVRMHYPDRTWPRILRAAGLPDEQGSRRQFLERFDLKKADAARALRHVARLLARETGLTTRPRPANPTMPSGLDRERPHDALAGEDPQLLKREVFRHQLASGKHRVSDTVRASLAEREAELAEALWAELLARGELDAEVYRWRALRQAEREARARGWTAGPLHRYVAEQEIAYAHGFSDWSALETALSHQGLLGSWVLAYRETLALARRVKEALFQQGLSWRSHLG